MFALIYIALYMYIYMYVSLAKLSSLLYYNTNVFKSYKHVKFAESAKTGSSFMSPADFGVTLL